MESLVCAWVVSPCEYRRGYAYGRSVVRTRGECQLSCEAVNDGKAAPSEDVIHWGFGR